MFTRLLVPTDFSPPSDAALEAARALAGAFHGSFGLLHVSENMFLRAKVTDPHDVQLAATMHLNDRLTSDDRERFQATAVMERSENPADEIVRYARTHDIDLIALGTHGRSGLNHPLMGSVAGRVARTAPVPVLTVRTAHKGEHAMFKRILVPVDFSAPSVAALEYARVLAEKFGASLRVLHVVEEEFVTGPLGSDMYMPPSSAEGVLRLHEAQQRLAAFVTDHDRTHLRATTDAIVGSGAGTIVDYAASNRFDLIVMGTHGRAGLAHLVMGSVAERVIRTAPCPVLTVRESPVRSEVPIGARRVGAVA
jgi:nucleotide-binding universal stress UspA family protein